MMMLANIFQKFNSNIKKKVIIQKIKRNTRLPIILNYL